MSAAQRPHWTRQIVSRCTYLWPLKAVGTAQYNSTMGVCVLADSPIRQPARIRTPE